MQNMSECEPNKNLFQDISKRCRTCLAFNAEINVFSKKIKTGNDNLLLAELLLKCASVQILEKDGLPQQICETCEEAVVKTHMFRIQCETSNKYLQSVMQRMQILKNSSVLLQEFVTECEDIGSEETITLTVENCKDNYDYDLNTLNEFEENDNNQSDSSANDEDTDQINEETLVSHTEAQIYQQVSPKNSSNLEDLKKRTCPYCDKIFQYRTSMLKHRKKHNAPPKTCPYCTFQPSTPNILSKHMEQDHSHLKAFTCSLCDKAFFKKANLRLHVQMHSGVKKHTCEICGLSFVLRGNLSVHRRLHTGERPYTCSACGRGFTQQSALRSHEAGHSDRRDHVCQECGAAFSRAGALKNHQKRHSSAKPFECSICGKKFTFSSERKRHVLIHSGDKNHECEVCGRRFTRNTNLKVHKRIHTGETPHVCQVCGKGFIQAHCLRTHMNTHGGDVT